MAVTDPPAGLPALPRRERYGTVLGSVAIFLFAFVFLGFWVLWDAAVPADEEIAPGTVIQVSQTVSYVPADGWAIDKSGTTAGSVSKITGGGSVLVVSATDYESDLASAVRRERALLEKAGKLHFASGSQTFRTANGLTGTRLSFYGTGVEGVLWMSLDPATKTLVKVTAESPLGGLQRALPDIQKMVDGVKVGGAA